MVARGLPQHEHLWLWVPARAEPVIGPAGGRTPLAWPERRGSCGYAASISTTIFPVVTCSPSATSIAGKSCRIIDAVCTCSIFMASSVMTGLTGFDALTLFDQDCHDAGRSSPHESCRLRRLIPLWPAQRVSGYGPKSYRPGARYKPVTVAKNRTVSIRPLLRKRMVSRPPPRVRQSRNGARFHRSSRHNQPSRSRVISRSWAPESNSIRIGIGNVAASVRPLRHGGA